MTDERKFSSTPCTAAVATARSLRLRRGASLLEILVALSLVVILFGAIATGTGQLSGARMRTAAGMVMTAVRAGIAHSNARGRPSRLVFDLDNQRLILEETRGRMLRVRDEDEGAKAGAAAATELEREASQFASEFSQGPRAAAPRFTPVSSFGGDESGPGYSLGSGIRYVQVQTEHDVSPVVEGRAYLYFWPGGGTEQAAIEVGRQGEFDGLTVLVSALTGRTRLHRGRFDMSESRQDTYFDEREEE